ncbi:fam151a protein [Chrysochromulina tobinii]|uniref:Fam151a protein n=1 Tax=Chrysochromulina tobinii TaxID=1460289 RepID=A0A0M0K4E9_9EUKA|nr:fam151a protein [Chrysochromulina tobinii]|eukprot:KOO33751.1 fam151a protein [Chrysochromulina sp. CCMP291]
MCKSSDAGSPASERGLSHASLGLALAHDCGPPYTPRPRAQQHWEHSCCSISKLERALANPDITAIEADIMVATEEQAQLLRKLGDRPGSLPIMAHPSPFSAAVPDTDLSFLEFLERCVSDGTRHLKLDFKQLAAVEPCLELLSERWAQLHANGQAVWLNADILPGPNRRFAPAVPSHAFIPLCRRLCPHAVLSLGWSVGPIGPEQVYTEADIAEMLKVCKEYSLPGNSVVFAASVRFAERQIAVLDRLLDALPDSQLLLWTGTGELPIPPALQTRIHLELAIKGRSDRIGYDVQLANSNMDHCASTLIDCTFFFSRWTRWACSCCVTSISMEHDLSRPIPGQIAGDRSPHADPPLRT